MSEFEKDMLRKYKCVDCDLEGLLNSEITYRGNSYICWPCYEKYWWGRKHTWLLEIYGKRSNKR